MSVWTEKQIRTLNTVAWIISTLVLLVVLLMRRIKIDTDVDFSFLPPFHSSVNALCGAVLVLALIFIKKGNVSMHKRLMTTAMLLSTVFLISYVVYHITTPEQRYCKFDFSRIVYFVLLISHVVFSALAFPFILFTYIRGLTGQYDRHRKMAKWVFPIWLYICFSGPLCYLMLRPCLDR